MKDNDFSGGFNGGFNDPEPDRNFCDYKLMSGNKCGEEATLGIPKFRGSSRGRSSNEFRFSCDKHRHLYVERDWREDVLDQRMKEDAARLLEMMGPEKVKTMSGYEKMRALLGSLPKALNNLVRKP